MRTVRDDDGTRYLLLKESTESSLVRDPETGEQQHLPNADLEPVDGESPLATAAEGVPDAARQVITAAHDERALGLLVELDDRGPLSVAELLSAYDLCESDLHGLLAEFRAAGLLAEATVHGQRGYDTTETASDGLAHLRD
ncbi:hypothetical protein BDK61_2977 [Haloarcula quadrata]|jgi:hypothetical protein|uniref:HTH domain protein n=4 Tax=Haloarcula TaxID=2237 RepID=Q5V178_HALMA|nr:MULTISPECIES: hypothetical protein [Haloarcula]AAV46725.1 unknown [Haloarcula marismortui ATCC 43049]EMA15730.1 hypothetical protein C436_02656 [Haloarcula sinaiiensis ATCC 33800]EMA20546.1 hypothetical protein C435_08230 [Haloarcula californiae ATCC 33799]NHX40563.1 hypothetical protein [Haloarcula sp. R1-2]QCP91439.1 hypothetical protein E6P14_11470 [Haloarcula marismortui ATCC 43049]